ncbi:hypothetical protein PN36_14475 [Candidatus Thiomargarita nelsonii]|uniref:Uncharacterized protein n=1 Tax=Candidatus Thiomargarita nelsonii TaxID=1003181 RepID=A0A0A6P4V6_9GAMM|nr:hypothetical protein PN36_14475 [Candidatus Thiomargarita nelsonii]
MAGLLLFGKFPQRFKPVFVVKAIVFPGDNVDISQYFDNEDIEGNLLQVYKDSFAFCTKNGAKKTEPNKLKACVR